MKSTFKRGTSAMLALLLVISLFSGLTVPAQAADLIKNYGYRGNTARQFSSYATRFYEKNGVTYEELAALSGSSDVDSVPSSPLYTALQKLMADNHTTVTTYDETREYFAYTDCQGEGDVISSFYSGTAIGPEWDSGATWNREHTWPNSKCLNQSKEDDSADIMMLRPTASSENSARGNKAYGVSSGFYNPNTLSGGLYNLHGDVARIVLYGYVRWGNTSYMWGSEGVIESVELLLDWMEEDPVDTWELGRNDVVMKITGTRNVFVDYPELAFLLFDEEVPAGMITPSGNSGESHTITATVNDPAMGSVTLAGTNIKAVPADGYQIDGYEVTAGEATVTQSGDIFTVSAKSDCTVQINFSLIPVPETLEEMLAEASLLENGTYLPYTTTVEGKVTEIDQEYSTKYKNICFTVDVDGTNVYCYRVKGDGMDTLAIGDTVRVSGNLTAYYNSPQFDSKATVTVLAKANPDPVVPEDPSDPESDAAVLDFSTTDNRTSQDSSAQIWEQNGITLTNNKAGSSTNVADYADPARFYAKSEIVIEYPNMTRIVFYCTGGSKYYLNTGDIQHLGTVTVNGSVVTLELAEPVDSVTYTCSNQNRYSKIEIYAAASEEEGCKHENLTATEAVAASCETPGNVAYWTCPDCQLYWLDEALTQQTTLEQTVVAPAHGQITHVEAREPTFEAEGNIEYWFCQLCGQAWLDAEGTRSTDLAAVILPKLTQDPDDQGGETENCKHENAEHVAAVAPTCAAPGTLAHYACLCGKNFADEACTQEMQSTVAAKDPTNHTGATKLANKKAATCASDGYTGDTLCSGCDALLQKGEVISNVSIAHTLEKVEAKAATCVSDGSKEHYLCSVCGKLFSDSTAAQELTDADVTLAALGHTFGSWTTVKKAEENVQGKKERTCKVCGYVESKTIPATSNPATGDLPTVLMLTAMTASALCALLLAAKSRGKLHR